MKTITCNGKPTQLVLHKQGRKIIEEPKRCPKCGDITTRNIRGEHGAVTYCVNKSCPAALFAKIDHWIGSSKKGVGILDIGDSILQTLWDNELVSDPADLYKLTVDQIKDLQMSSGVRIGESRAKQIINNIDSKRVLDLDVFLGSLGIELLGRRRVKLLTEAANGQLDNLSDWLDDNKLSSIQLPGFGDAIRKSIRLGIDENRKLINKLETNGVTTLKSVVVQQPVGQSTEKLPLAGLSFCWTGCRDHIADVERLGGTVKSGISKGLNYLVQKDAMSSSNKTQKAESLGTKIISIDYLKRVIDGEVTLND